MNVFHFAVKSITYRYGADRSKFSIGNTHVGTYISAETGCLWFIGAVLPAYTYAAIILPRLHNNFRFFTGNASSPNVKERVLTGVKIGEWADGSFPIWKHWYRFFSGGFFTFCKGILGRFWGWDRGIVHELGYK